MLAGAGIANPGISLAQTTVDYDTDDNGLIEVDSLAKLNAIRYDLNGDGQVAAGDATSYAAGFPNFDAASCPDNDMPADGASYDCEGYELTANLDFDTDNSGSTHTAGTGDANDTYYNGGAGWTPIGVSSTGAATAYTATFDGNNNTISNLFINLNTSTNDGGSFVGLFGDFNGTIRNVGLVNPYIANTRAGSGWDRTGALAGRGQGNAVTISNSYVSGGSVTLSQNTNSLSSSVIGCLVGFIGPSNGTISDSWSSCALSVDSTGANTGTVYAGGLVGQYHGAISGSYATGTVTSLGTVNNDIGGLVGWIEGSITSSYAVGNVTSSNSVGIPSVGGLVGSGSSGVNIRASYAIGNVSDSGADSRVGGLAGLLAGPSAVVQASYAAGSVTASGATSATGGLIGQSLLSNGQVQAVYASGAISNSGTGRSTGGLVGYLTGSAPTMPVASNGYWDTAATGQMTTVGGGQGKTTSELQSPISYAGIYANWNVDADGDTTTGDASGNDDPWHFGADNQYPILKFGHDAASIGQQLGAVNVDYDANDNNLIDVSTLPQLNAIRYDLNGDGQAAAADATNYALAYPGPAAGMGCPDTCAGYDLVADLDFDTDGSGSITTADGPISYGSSGAGWVPIGLGGANPAYTGRFHGNSHTIANMMINAADVLNVGLFGWANGGPIENVGLTDVDLTANYATGNFNSFAVGGLVGTLTGTMRGSYATGAIVVNVTTTSTTATSTVGGLVGRTFNAGAIAASYATAAATLTSTSTDTQPDAVGGLIGTLAAAGSVTASYAAGSVSANRDSARVGGLIGLTGQADITASYATGRPTATGSNSQVGGLIGDLHTNATVTASYWDTVSSGVPDSNPANSPGAGKTNIELTAPTGYTGDYAAWNANVDGVDGDDDPWDFGGNLQYPVLTYGNSAAGIAAQKTTQDTTLRSVTGTNVDRTIATGGAAYTLEIIPPETTAVTLTLTPTQSDAVIGSLATATPGASVDGLEVTLAAGETPTLVTVTVTAPNGHYTRQYTLTLQRIFGPEAALSGPAHAVGEGQDAEFTVLVRRTSESPVTVRWTASGNAPTTPADFANADHTAPLTGFPAGTVTVPAGADQTATISIPIYDDETAEGSETFQVTITGVSGGAARFDATPATATIALSDPTLALRAPDGTGAGNRADTPLTAASRLVITEGRANAYTIRLADNPGENVAVVIHSNHDSITTTPDRVTFTADNHDQPQRVTVNAAPDGDAKNETATLTHILTNANGGLLEIIDQLPLFVADTDPPEDDDIC